MGRDSGNYDATRCLLYPGAMAPVGTWLLLACMVLAVLALLPRNAKSGPAATLLRCLLPSWRFFEYVEEPVHLRYRTRARDAAFGAWQTLREPPPRSPWSLVWNPRGNLWLAERSIVDRFADDLIDRQAGEPDTQESFRVSYALAQGVVLWELQHAPADAPQRAVECYQFSLASSADGQMRTLWTSEEHALIDAAAMP